MRFFIVCLMLGFAFLLNAQNCQLDLSIPDDITICKPQQISVSGVINGPYFGFEWSGTNGFYNNVNLNNQVWVDQTTTFTLKAFGESQQNLIQNPSFENGNTGFTTLYNYNPTTLWSEGTYTVTNNPNSVHTGFSACSAHEGTQMMVLNGSVSLAQIWCQSVPVTPNTNYVFWAWATSVNPSNPARLQFSINNTLVGQQLHLTGTLCQWQQFYTVWNSGNNTTADICIVNQNTNPSGNDFALDDLFFGPLCEEEKEFTVTLENFTIADANVPPITCFDPEQIITAFTTPYLNGLSYSWGTLDGVINSNPYFQDIYVASAGTYTVTVTSQNQCTEVKSFIVTSDNLPPDLAIFGNNTLNCNELTSYIEAYTFGNTNASYQWTRPDNSLFTGSGFYATSPGLYTVTATTPNGCSDTASIQIVLQNAGFDYQKKVGGPLSCSQDSVSVFIENKSGIDSLIWISAPLTKRSGTFDTTWVKTPGVYHFSVKEGKYCIVHDSIVISAIPPIHEYTISEPDTITCHQPQVTLTLSNTKHITDTKWYWNGIEIYSADSSGVSLSWMYHLTAIDTNGCLRLDSVFVFENKTPPLFDVLTDTIDCIDNAGGFIVNYTGQGSFLWQGPFDQSDQQNPQFSKEGEYTLTITGANGCFTTRSYYLPASKDYPDISAEIEPITCFSPIGSLHFSTDIAAQLSWIAPDQSTGNTSTILSDVTGIYTVTATTQSGCVATQNFELVADTLRPSLSLIRQDTLTCLKTKVSPEINAGDYTHFSWSGSGNYNPVVLSPDFSQPGMYTLTLINQNGCTQSQTYTIIADTLKPVFTARADSLTCFFPTATLHLTSPSNPVFSIENQIIENGFLIDQPGQYRITAKAENGCESFVILEVKGYFEKHDIQLDTVLINCYNPSAWIKDKNYNNSNQYTWWLNMTAIVNSDSLLIEENTGSVSVKVTNIFGCISEANLVMAENFQKPVPQISGNLEIDCEESHTVIEVNNPGADEAFYWYDTANKISEEWQIRVEKPGNYLYVVKNTVNGCIDSLHFTVIKEPKPEKLDFVLTLPVCAEDNAEVFIHSPQGGTAPYKIFLDEQLIVQNKGYTLRDKRMYKLSIQDKNGCGLDTSLTISPLPSLILDAGRDTTLLLGESTMLNPSNSVAWDSLADIRWEPREGLSCWTCPDATASPDISTLFTLFVTDQNGCSKQDSVWVRIRRINGFDVPNVIIPNSASQNNRFTIYSRYNSIEIIERLVVYDRWGNKVFEIYDLPPGEDDKGWDGTFHNQSALSGVYVWMADIRYKTGEKEMVSGDVLVTN